MSGYPKVEVIGALGFEDFEAELIMEVRSVSGELMSVVVGGDDVDLVVLAPHVYVIDLEMDCS